MLKRLKRQWQQDWEAELIAEQARTHEEICASIDAKLNRMRAAQLEHRRTPDDGTGDITIAAEEDDAFDDPFDAGDET